MKAYNVEIFDPSFTYRHHTNVSSLSYTEDYVSPESNSITILKPENAGIKFGDYIRITRGDIEIFGVITRTQDTTKSLLTVDYKPFLSYFDLDVLFDTSVQNSAVSLEEYLSQTILEYFAYNKDDVMNLSGIVIHITSKTEKWTFNISPDDDASYYSGLSADYDGVGKVTLHSSYGSRYRPYSIVNLFKVLIVRAFEKYSVRIKPVPNFRTKKISLYVGVNKSSERTLESDLPNITKKNIIVDNRDSGVNKVVVYNSETYGEPIIFYRHSDNTFSSENRDRILPVVQEIYTAAPTYEDDIIVVTFREAAVSQAMDAFSAIENNNLIELTMTIDDALYLPMSFDMGQKVKVISGNEQYSSALSGFTIDGSSITLIFGNIRADLTKRIRRSSYGY